MWGMFQSKIYQMNWKKVKSKYYTFFKKKIGTFPETRWKCQNPENIHLKKLLSHIFKFFVVLETESC